MPRHPSDDFETMAPAPEGRRQVVRGGGLAARPPLPPLRQNPVVASAEAASALSASSDTATDTQGRRSRGKGLSLKARAINYLARREHSRQELARKLAPHIPPEQAEDSEAIINALLDDLERENWQSDERFAQSMAHRRGAGRGTALVMQELRQHGLDSSELETVRDQLRSTELQRADEAWRKKFGQLPDDAKAYAKQARFMASRGFSGEAFKRVLAEFKQSELD